MAKVNNDKAILDLKKKVEDKKKLIKDAQKPHYVTNLSLNLDEKNYNLNAIGSNRDQLVYLIAKLGSLTLGHREFGIELSVLNVSGFRVIDWISDLRTKYNILNVKEEQDRLKILEERLHNLLSSDTKVKLELDDLASQI